MTNMTLYNSLTVYIHSSNNFIIISFINTILNYIKHSMPQIPSTMNILLFMLHNTIYIIVIKLYIILLLKKLNANCKILCSQYNLQCSFHHYLVANASTNHQLNEPFNSKSLCLSTRAFCTKDSFFFLQFSSFF